MGQQFKVGLPVLLTAMLYAMSLRLDAFAEDRIATLQALLPAPVREALPRISGSDRQLLALRSYLRSTRTIADRWSWTQDEIDPYMESDGRKAALEAVAKVTAAFEKANGGYTLHVNTQVRSLDEQIDNWNKNASVGTAAADLERDTRLWLEDNPTAKATDFRAYLSSWEPAALVFIAAPGLSLHGRAHAFDFQIYQGGTIVADTNTRTIDSTWNAEGWAEKLKAAVKASGAPFVGPLENPPEPWHYDYRP